VLNSKRRYRKLKEKDICILYFSQLLDVMALWEGILKLCSAANSEAHKYDEEPLASAVCSAGHTHKREKEVLCVSYLYPREVKWAAMLHSESFYYDIPDENF
jgi:hypothetical protein